MAKTEIPDQKNFDQFEAELTASSNEVEAGGDWAFDRGMYTIKVTPRAIVASCS